MPRTLVNHPNERSPHARPVSRAGGVAIAVAVAVGFAIAEAAAPGAPE